MINKMFLTIVFVVGLLTGAGTVAADAIEADHATYFLLTSVSQAGSNGIVVSFLLANDNTNIIADSGVLNILLKKEDAGKTYLNKMLKVNASDFDIATAILYPYPHPQYRTKRLTLDTTPNEGDKIDAYLTFTTASGNILEDHQPLYWN